MISKLGSDMPWGSEKQITPGCRHIVVGDPKGGVGKSTLTWHFALATMLAGHTVVLADGDEQQSLKKIQNKRKSLHKDLPYPPCITFHGDENIVNAAKVYAEQGAEYIFYDVGGFMSDEILRVYGFADLIIAPYQASQIDLDSLVNLQRVIRHVNNNLRGDNGLDPISAKIVLNRLEANANSQSTSAALKTLETINVPEFDILDTHIKNLVGFAHAIGGGLSAQEQAGSGANNDHAARTVNKFVKFILRGQR